MCTVLITVTLALFYSASAYTYAAGVCYFPLVSFSRWGLPVVRVVGSGLVGLN